MHPRTLISVALLAAIAMVFVSCTSAQLPKAGTPNTSSKLTPSPTSTPEPASIYTPEPTAATLPTPKPAPAPTFTPAPSYLTQEIPPCTPVEGASVDPCGDVEPDLSQNSGEFGSEPESIRSQLDGSRADGTWVAHVVLLGAYVPSTVRCEISRGRNGLPGYYGAEKQIAYAPINAVNCYADVRVNAYVVGSGPPTLTVLARIYPYWPSETSEYFAFLRNSVEAALIEGGRHDRGTEVPAGGITGREHVLFLGVSSDITVEAWEVISTWDVRRLEEDTVIAVHPNRHSWRHLRPDGYRIHRSKLEMEISVFTRAARAAHQARLDDYGGRTGSDARLPMLVTDANRISQYYTEIGAYDHPYVSAVRQPPPPCGLSVANPADNPGLMLDCITLLTVRDTLAGTATLDWSVDAAITGWKGVTVSGTPKRVTKILLPDESLSGMIPLGLGDLSALTHLNLSSNSLTGKIPKELGGLLDLREVRLTSNPLTGCIPLALKQVPNNDLSSHNLLDCPPKPEGLTAGTPGENSVALNWTAVSNASKYRVERRLRRTNGFAVADASARNYDWVVADDKLTGTSHTMSGFICEWEYSFRVTAYGDGTNFGAGWGEPSDILSSFGGECILPTFDAPSHSFSVPGDATIGTPVGTVAATGSGSNDPVAYWLSGDEYSIFSIDETTGQITVAGNLSPHVSTSFSLTVKAWDVSGGTATVDVNIDVIQTGDDGTAVRGD